MDHLQFRQRERMFLHGYEMQADAVRGGLPQSPPGGQKIQPCAKSALDNRKTIGLVPTFRQIVAVQEDMLCLREGALRRRIDVIEPRGEQRTVAAE